MIKPSLITWTSLSTMDVDSLNNPPDFLKNLNHKRIIIIGNGPSAIGQKLGQTIDDFDIIVRINNYVVENMESEVGSRTDIWVNGANQGLLKRSVIPQNILVMIPPSILERKGEDIHKRIIKRLGTDHYYMLPLEVMSKMEKTSKISRPTTGFFTIYFLYLLGFDITLHGFDFFVGSTSHYFDSPFKKWLKDKGIIKKGAKHNVSAEKTFVENLINQRKIKLLENKP